MKKFFVAALCVFIAGCQVPQYIPDPSRALIKVSWKQEGKDCVYEEIYGSIKQRWKMKPWYQQTTKSWENQSWDRDESTKEEQEYVSAVKTITYGNTLCSKVIDAELKNKTNKSAIENNFHELHSVSTTNLRTVNQNMWY